MLAPMADITLNILKPSVAARGSAASARKAGTLTAGGGGECAGSRTVSTDSGGLAVPAVPSPCQ